METEDIIGIMDAFNFDSQINERRVDFIQNIFKINIDPIEVQLSKKKIAEIIQGRLIMDESCPKCHGWGCLTCRSTGKNVQAVYK